jgi:uroporphyrinogen-III decarboxylase
LLPAGTVAEVEAAVRQVIEDAAAGGGLIIDSSNTYHPGVKPENVMAVFEATHKYGAYPPRPQGRQWKRENCPNA